MAKSHASLSPEERAVERRRHLQEHGRTGAAWTTVFILIAGSVVCGAAVLVAEPVLFGVGVAIGVLGIIVGKVMSMAGMGAMPSPVVEAPAGTGAEGPSRTERQKDLDTFTDV
jgi:hypothetical protein